MNASAIFPAFLIVAVILILSFIIGAYVYRDAKRRKMNECIVKSSATRN